MLQLEQLRRFDRESLASILQDMHCKEVRALAQAAGLRVKTDGNVTWMASFALSFVVLDEIVKDLFNMSSGVEVRKSKLRKSNIAAPEEIACGFGLFLVIASHDVSVRMSGSPLRSSARPGNGLLQILSLQRLRK